MFFELSSLALGLMLFGVVLAATALGLVVGHRLRGLSDSLREPFAVLQAALLGVVGLLLAFAWHWPSTATSRAGVRSSPRPTP
jgi:hypothetical protein